MKKITTLLLLAGVSGLLSAGDLQLNDKGYFELDGWRATPTTYSESWQALQPTTSREVFKKIDSESGVLFQMNFAGDVSENLRLHWRMKKTQRLPSIWKTELWLNPSV